MNENLKAPSTGTDSFCALISDNCYYVDKTSLIKSVFSSNKDRVLLITRPRRFGKSLTMSMFKSFFAINPNDPSDLSFHERLFKDTKIFKEKEFCSEYMGQYPVVFISFKGIEGLSFNNAFRRMADLISSTAQSFEFLQNSSKLSLKDKENFSKLLCCDSLLSLSESSLNAVENSLKLLTNLLFKHYGKKVILLIDEYDVPFAKASVNGYYQRMVELIREMFQKVLKSNDDNLQKAVLTGCLRVSKESIFTGLNNLKVNTVFDTAQSLSTGIGFTTDETYAMLSYYGLSQYESLIKRSYNGYNFGNYEIFCAKDVVSFCSYALDNPNLNQLLAPNFWVNTSSNDLISEFLGSLSSEDSDDMQCLIDGGVIRKKLRTDMSYEDLKQHRSEDFWSILAYTGYLTVAGVSDFNVDAGEINLKIPNESVRLCFKDRIAQYFKNDAAVVSLGTQIVQAFFSGNSDCIRILLNNALSNFISIRDFSSDSPKEYYYHGFLNGFFASQKNAFRNYSSNRESGVGYPDIMFSNNDESIGVIIELKYASKQNELFDKSLEALKQIDENNYPHEFSANRHIRKIYCYGISFCKKSCDASLKVYEKD